MVDNLAAASRSALAASGVNHGGGNASAVQYTAQQQGAQPQTARQNTLQQNTSVRQSTGAQRASAPQRGAGPGEQNQLSRAERQRVQELQQRDREVRQHERAHQAAGGSVTGAASFTFTQGPDGQRYAVSGEVSIDTSTEDEPRETIAKMQTVIRAALAPAEPSSQDQKVAAQARAQLAQAQQQLSQQQTGGDAQQGRLDGNGITIAQNAGSQESSRGGNQRAATQVFEQAQARADNNRQEARNLFQTTA